MKRGREGVLQGDRFALVALEGIRKGWWETHNLIFFCGGARGWNCFLI